MVALRTVICSVGCVATLGSGYILWCLVAPGEERRKAIIKNLPEANPQRLKETQMRNVLMMQALKEAAETNVNVARGFGGAGK